MIEKEEDSPQGIPPHLRGMWGHWDVKRCIRPDISFDSPELGLIDGLFLGFGSGGRAEWARQLPALSNIKYLVSWTGNNSQVIFDAIAKMHWLKRLCFGRLAANDISGFCNLRNLECLCIHQISGVKDLRPISRLPKLRVIELGVTDKIKNLEWLEHNKLESLQSFQIYGTKSKIKFPSITQLAIIPTLNYISIPTVWASDSSLLPLKDLPNLKFLHLSASGWPKLRISALQNRNVVVKFGL